MFVIPDGSKDEAMGAMQKFLEDGASPESGRRSPPEKAMIGGRTVSIVDFRDQGAWAWWSQDGHFVVAAMSGSAEELTTRLSSMADSRRSGANDLTENFYYRKLAASRNYATLLSGFIDIRSMLQTRLPDGDDDEQQNLLKDWGLYDIRGLTFSCGFEGKAWRESYALYLDPQRRGFWQILQAAEQINIEQLPALPADATNICVGAFDTGRLIDIANKTIDAIENSNEAGKEQDATTTFLKGIVKQVAAPLGPQVVWFNSPSEGGFLIDQAVAIQAKDPSALNALLWLAYSGQQFKGWFSGGDDSQDFLRGVSLKKQSYRGVDYWTIPYPMDDASLAPSFVIHDGWLVAGFHPQIVQGYILRTRRKCGKR
jgi:hypothetical protein